MPELIFLTYLMEGLLFGVFVLLVVAALVHNHRRGRKTLTCPSKTRSNCTR